LRDSSLSESSESESSESESSLLPSLLPSLLLLLLLLSLELSPSLLSSSEPDSVWVSSSSSSSEGAAQKRDAIVEQWADQKVCGRLAFCVLFQDHKQNEI
jgi:hypothetical protein